MAKLKILVACHKAAEVPNNEVYMPLHVGKELHPELDLGFTGDNTGDNISSKNASYCELTAQYWGWKNLDCEYIGLAHYRRYFEPVFTADNVEQLMDGKDIVLAKPFHFACSIDQFWMSKLIPEDVTVFYLVLQRHFPREYAIAERYLTGNLFYPCNMFVCRKELFDEYAAWQFDVLEKVEQVLPVSGYSRERRILGYLAEAMLPLWMIGNGLSVKTYHVVGQPGQVAVPHTKTKVKIAWRDWRTDRRYARHRPQQLTIADDYMAGLKQDGIIDKINAL